MKSNFGTLLKISMNSTYQTVKGVFVVPPIQSSQEKIEVTHHDQDSPYRKFIPSGLIDPGDYAFQMRSERSDSTQAYIYTLFKSGAVGDWQIVYPDGLTQSFSAYVLAMTCNEADATSPDPVNITVALAICGGISESEDSL